MMVSMIHPWFYGWYDIHLLFSMTINVYMLWILMIILHGAFALLLMTIAWRKKKIADESFNLLEKSSMKNGDAKWRWRSPQGAKMRWFCIWRCCTAKSILLCFRVLVDERNISMHALFQDTTPIKMATLRYNIYKGDYISWVENCDFCALTD